MRVEIRTSGRVLILAGSWLALLAATLVLTALAAVNDTLPGDVAITSRIQGLPSWLERPAGVVRAITSTEVALALGALIAMALWAGGRQRSAITLVIGLVLLAALQSEIKEVVDRPRPDPALVEIRASYSSPSFPSGHVMSGALLYGFLAFFALRILSPPLVGCGIAGLALALVLAAGPPNVYLGVHWPSDVLGGYAWAALLLAPLVLAESVRA